MRTHGRDAALHLGVASLASLAILALAPWVACTESPPAVSSASAAAQLPTTQVTLPNGALIQAELAISPEEQARGLMFRAELAPDRGMLFVGGRSAPRSFWMFQCLIPLDLIWMDGSHRIVEIVRAAPPCGSTDPADCPSYGGNANSVYVLELAAGQVDAHGLRLGDRLEF